MVKGDALGWECVGSFKRIGHLQTLSTSLQCLEFAPGKIKAILHLRPGLGCLPMWWGLWFCRFFRLHLMWWRKMWDEGGSGGSRNSNWCFGSHNKGFPASKQTISNWIVQAISLAYQVYSFPSPLVVRAHSTGGMESSRAHLSEGTYPSILCPSAHSWDFIVWTYP